MVLCGGPSCGRAGMLSLSSTTLHSSSAAVVCPMREQHMSCITSAASKCHRRIRCVGCQRLSQAVIQIFSF